MAYRKPQILAQNGRFGSFAAACPTNTFGSSYECRRCDRAQ